MSMISAQIDELRATAEEIDWEFPFVASRLRGAAGTITELEAENAKLRELMSVMAYCNQFRRDCDGCSLNGAAGIITERAGCDELLARLRERGVVAGE